MRVIGGMGALAGGSLEGRGQRFTVEIDPVQMNLCTRWAGRHRVLCDQVPSSCWDGSVSHLLLSYHSELLL